MRFWLGASQFWAIWLGKINATKCVLQKKHKLNSNKLLDKKLT
jgi:putative sterol carrier protein